MPRTQLNKFPGQRMLVERISRDMQSPLLFANLIVLMSSSLYSAPSLYPFRSNVL
jgi:hypothetical protein